MNAPPSLVHCLGRPISFTAVIAAIGVPVNLDVFQLINLGCLWSHSFHGALAACRALIPDRIIGCLVSSSFDGAGCSFARADKTLTACPRRRMLLCFIVQSKLQTAHTLGTFLIYTLGPLVVIVAVLPALFYLSLRLGVGNKVHAARRVETRRGQMAVLVPCFRAPPLVHCVFSVTVRSLHSTVTSQPSRGESGAILTTVGLL